MRKERRRSRARRVPSLAEAAAEVLASVAVHQDARLDRVRLAWPRICGPALSRVAEPLRFDDRRLVIGVRGAVWREALFEQRDALYRALRAVTPGLGGIRLETLPELAPEPLTPPEPPPPPVPPDPRNADVEDAELRAELDALSAVLRRGEAET